MKKNIIRVLFVVVLLVAISNVCFADLIAMPGDPDVRIPEIEPARPEVSPIRASLPVIIIGVGVILVAAVAVVIIANSNKKENTTAEAKPEEKVEEKDNTEE